MSDIQNLTASLDLKQNLNIFASCKQFDSLSLILSIYNNSLQADLSNYDVRLRAMKADKVPLIQHIGITINSNVVNIEADEQLTTTAGKTPIELQFIDKTTGKKKATFNLVLIVVPSTLEVDRTISKATYTLLEELENKLDQASDFLENIDEAINANSTLEGTISSANTANNNLESNIDDANASKLALDTSKTNADNSKNALDLSVTNANNTKTALDLSKTDADTSKSELEAVVQEANQFVQDHPDASNLIETVAEHSASLSEMAKLTDIFTNARTTKFIGHRGLSAIAPENTIPSWELAAKCGMWGAECDIYTTSDGVWVVMHDTTVDRTTNGTGLVSSFTLNQIKALTIDTGNNISLYPNLKVSTFEEYLITCKKSKLVPVVEIKATDNESNYDTLVELIRRYGYEESIIIISFDYAALQKIRNRSSKIMIQYLSSITTDNINRVIELGNAGLDVSYTDITTTKDNIELAHKNGILINCWTVDDHQIAKTLINYGVDFITSNIIVGVI